MSESNDHVFPSPEFVHLGDSLSGYRGEIQSTGGLTKRELFAAMAMQALLTRRARGDFRDEWIAKNAVARAEDLLNELDESPCAGLGAK